MTIVPLTIRLVSTMILGFALLSLIPLLTNLLNDPGYIGQNLVRILVGVALTDSIDCLPESPFDLILLLSGLHGWVGPVNYGPRFFALLSHDYLLEFIGKS